MPAHPERVRRNHEDQLIELRAGDVPIRIFASDIRALLNHLEREYVGPEISNTMKRLREVVGYGS